MQGLLLKDYRPKNIIQDEKWKKTTTNQTTKFHQLQQRWSNTVDISPKDMFRDIGNGLGDKSHTEHELRLAYQAQSDQIQKLEKQLSNSEKRVKELEDQIRLFTKL